MLPVVRERARGKPLVERHILLQPPTREELAAMARLAPGGVRDLVATRSRRYKELGLADKNLTDDEWLDLLAQEPRLLRRPLITDGSHLTVGKDADGLSAWLRPEAP